MTDWVWVPLEKLAVDEKSAISKPYGSAILKEDYRDSGVPVVRGVNLAKGIFHDDDFVFIDDDLAVKMPGAEMRSGDLVVTHRGTVGQVSMIPRSSRFPRYVASTSHVKVRLDLGKAIPEFYYYWFASPEGQHSILSNVSVVGVPGLAQPVATVKQLQVPFPSPPQQRAIADILSALDDKIAANERVIAAASHLMLGVVQSVEQSVPLSALVRQTTESVKPDQFAEAVAHFSLPAFDVGALPEIVHGRTIKSNKFLLSQPCVLFSKLNPRIPRIWDVESLPGEMALASTEFVVLIPQVLATSLVWAALCQAEVSEKLQQMVAGTSGSHQRIRPQELLSVEVRDVRALDSMSASGVSHLGHVCYERRRESARLVRTRDELLPLLMSGKLRVRDAEAVAAEVL